MNEPPEGVQVVGEGENWSHCPTCPPEKQVVYRNDDPQRVKAEARDHKEWHPTHFPFARGPEGERIYG